MKVVMNAKLLDRILLIVGLIALAVIVFSTLKRVVRKQSPPETVRPSAIPSEAVATDKQVYPPPVAARDFTIEAKNYSFSRRTIEVKKGVAVRIYLKVIEGKHDWVIDEFSARTKVVSAGQEDMILFTADKTGTYEYYCSVGDHRAMGMKGQLVVTE